MMTITLMTWILILKTNLIYLGKSLLLAYLIAHFKPLQDVLTSIGNGLNNIIFDYFNELVSCMLCLTFWICLIISGNIYLAVIGYILAKIYNVRFSHWEKWTPPTKLPDYLK